MPQPATHFAWTVPADGYRWADLESAGVVAKPGRWLTAGCHPAGGARLYRPLVEHSGLCRILADTEPSEAGMQAFADRYRPARRGRRDDPAAGDADRRPGRRRREAGVWPADPAAALGHRALGAGHGRRRRALAPAHPLGPEGGWVGYDSHLGLAPGAPPPAGGARARDDLERQTQGPAGEVLQHGDVVRPAFIWVGQKVNEALKDRVSPQLRWNQARTALSLQLVPSSLGGALWLQLA